MRATLKNYRQSPRKVRLIADAVRGMSVDKALTTLLFLPKRASLPFRKVISSAVSNAKQNNGLDAKDLMVKSTRVDQGIVFRRWQPRARGRAAPVRKKTSHIFVELAESLPTKTDKSINLKSLPRRQAGKT